MKGSSQFKEDFLRRLMTKVLKDIYFQYLEKLLEVHNDLPFLPERIKIEKVEKLVAILYDYKTGQVIPTRNLKQTLNHRLVLKKVHDWLKPYIDMNADLRKKAKSHFGNDE